MCRTVPNFILSRKLALNLASKKTRKDPFFSLVQSKVPTEKTQLKVHKTYTNLGISYSTRPKFLFFFFSTLVVRLEPTRG